MRKFLDWRDCPDKALGYTDVLHPNSLVVYFDVYILCYVNFTLVFLQILSF